MTVSKWFFGVVLIVCCHVTASDRVSNISNKTNGWNVECIKTLNSKTFVVYDNNRYILYKVSFEGQGDWGSYNGKRVCPVIKKAERGDNRFPFCMGNAKDNFNYISNWYNSILHDKNQNKNKMTPPLIIPTGSHAKIVPIKSSNQREEPKIVSEKAYRIYNNKQCNFEYYTNGFREKYTAFEGKNALYSVTKSVKSDKYFYIDETISKNIYNYPFYQGNARKSYQYFNSIFADYLNGEKWSDPLGKITLKIIERDKRYISQIVANSKECKHRVIDRETIIDNKKTNNYLIKEMFIPGHDYGNGDNK